MSTINNNKGNNHNFSANLRIYHGGHFVTNKYRTEYVEGSLMLKFDESEICYFDLMHIVKNELKIEDGEIWFRRHGLSLFAGRKKLNDDKDIETLMATKDKEGFIDLYVVHGQKEKEGQVVVNTVGGNQIIRATHFLKQPITAPPNIPLNKSFRSKIPFLKAHETLNSRGLEEEVGGSQVEEKGEDTNEDDESDEDVVLSEADFDDEEDDDLFFENVDEDVSEELGLNQLNGNVILEEDKDVGGEDEEGGKEDEDGGIESEDSGSEEVELVSDADELGSDKESDGGEVKIHYPTFNPLSDFQRPIQLTLGLKFPSNTVLRKAIRHHAIENGYDYFFCHNDRKRVCIYCRYRCKCPWLKGKARLGKCKCDKSVKKCRYRLNATKVPGEETFQIMGLRLNHKCGWNDINPKLSAEYLAERYLDNFRIDPEWKIDIFQKRVLLDIGVEIGYYKAYYAKQRALNMIFGVDSDEYKRVWDYAATIKKYIRGSSVYVKLGNIERPPPVFERMYMCLEACKKGFVEGCRPLLGIDGCHLKGNHPGQLLTAVGKDDIDTGYSKMTFMSDRQKGLLEALNRVVPNAESRYCCRHIWTNFKKSWPGQAFKQCFWSAARAYTKEDHEVHMGVMRSMSVEAHAYLTSIPSASWCRHGFTTNCTSGMLLNNCCESFNNVLRKCRDKPILSLMEWMTRYNMKRIFQKKEGADKYEGKVMPAVMKQLDITSKLSRHCKLFQSEAHYFEVEYHAERFVVDLHAKTCGCKKWDITGIPCPHVFACIIKKRLDPEDFVHPAYSKEMYLKAYGTMIKALPGPKQWEHTEHPQPAPPAYRKMPGRPSTKKMRKEVGENEERQLVKKRNTRKKCGNCGQLGHNKKSCKNPTVAQPRKRTQQRRNVAESVEEILQAINLLPGFWCVHDVFSATRNPQLHLIRLVEFEDELEKDMLSWNDDRRRWDRTGPDQTLRTENQIRDKWWTEDQAILIL
ncbi:hypothetical protein KSS87_002582, partial [Heliosperma pusillum]